MKKIVLLLICFVCISSLVFGQQITHHVVSSSSDSFKAEGSQIGWTLGEIVTDSYSNSHASLSHGFQSTGKNNKGIKNKLQPSGITSGYTVMAFPNPAVSSIHVILGSAWTAGTFIELVDIYGRTVLTENVTDLQSITIDISSLNMGVYILNVKTQNSNIIKSLKINKIN
jgi:Secretion system C-terminal sorting domain